MSGISTWTRLASCNSLLDHQLSTNPKGTDIAGTLCVIHPHLLREFNPVLTDHAADHPINSHGETPMELKNNLGDSPYGIPSTKIHQPTNRTGVHMYSCSEWSPMVEIGSLYYSQSLGYGNWATAGHQTDITYPLWCTPAVAHQDNGRLD